jgi:hypothetical protein
MNKLNTEKQRQVIASLVEGNSIRSTVRMTGVAKNTIVKLLADVGKACAEYQYQAFRNLNSSGYSVTRYGHSVMPKKRTFLKTRKVSSVMAMCIHGRQ